MGILNLRGQVVPVIDLRRLLNSETTSLQPEEHLIVVRAGEQCLALRVDRAEGLCHVRAEEICSSETAWADCKVVAGIVNVNAEFVLLLDPENLLSRMAVEPLALSPEGT
jgi:purine-binding chemotaxis protein CheW